MLRSLSPALLVILGSCQFNGNDREVEILPGPSESEAVASEQGSPVAEFGSPNADVEEALALRLAEQTARTKAAQEEADRLRALTLAAEEARADAEEKLLTAEAALSHERSQRGDLEKERDFLLARIREIQIELLAAEDDLVLRRELEEQIANLELELYEARVYEGPLQEKSIAEALQAAQATLVAEEGELEFFSAGNQSGLRLSGKVLFLSGQVELDPDGLTLLEQLAVDLLPLAEAGALIQVVGHTDNEPIQAQAGRFPLGNVQLSCYRAMVVAQALAEAGLPRHAMTISGMGAMQPLVPNDSEEGRARNRRVEIMVTAPPAPPESSEPLADATVDPGELEKDIR